MIKNLFFKLLKAVHSRQRKYKGSDIESAWYVYVPENVIVRRQRNNYHSNGNKLLLAHRCGLYFFFLLLKGKWAFLNKWIISGLGLDTSGTMCQSGKQWNYQRLLPKITVRRIQERGKAQRWDTLIINKIIIEWTENKISKCVNLW